MLSNQKPNKSKRSAPEGELLTDDEQADRERPRRWHGEVRDIPQTIRALAKLHGVASDEVIEESESWFKFIDELSAVISQLVNAPTTDTNNTNKE